MRFQAISAGVLSAVVLIFSGCSGNSTPPNTVSNTAPAANNAVSNSNNPLAASPTPKVETVNKGETLAPVVKAYCDAMTNKDDAALRKVYSQDTLKYFEGEMKADKKKSLIEYLSETDHVSNILCEIRNEKIEGNTAIAELRTESYPNGIKIKFVKENNEWKFTNVSPEFDAVKNAAANSNNSK
jgi:Putative lumazine-binding